VSDQLIRWCCIDRLSWHAYQASAITSCLLVRTKSTCRAGDGVARLETHDAGQRKNLSLFQDIVRRMGDEDALYGKSYWLILQKQNSSKLPLAN
jgi:hypothetical protein